MPKIVPENLFYPIKGDRRYTATFEYCGHSTPRWVARFCDEFLGSGEHHTDATMFCLAHSDERERELNSH